MLVVDRGAGTLADRRFVDFPEYVNAGDCVTFNDTRVLPARLYGRRARTGGAVEALLVKPVSPSQGQDEHDEPGLWEALLRPGRKMRLGDRAVFGDVLEARVVAEGEGGLRTLEFTPADRVIEIVERIGHTPLPPYIRRPVESRDEPTDRERYQTVFAKHPASAAAPTAGLHFTPEILSAIEARGAQRAEITLEVGLGTFQSVRVENVEEHHMHAERFSISEEAAAKIRKADRVVAVGTTTARTLEHAAAEGRERLGWGHGETDIFITPGYRFQAVGALLTNFHLPESTLLMLVAAFAGRELTLQAYRHAVEERYRFYSYGDCMLIV